MRLSLRRSFSYETKANVLADFFTSVFTKEPEGDVPELDPIIIEEPASELNINQEKIAKLLRDLDTSKAPGPDGLHPHVLKVLADRIKEPLYIIFSKSLQTGCVPKLWKQGRISAIFKKGDKADPGNYRPVSLTSIVCKVFEKLVREHLLEHLTKNSLISNKQFGFLPGRSTTLQLLKVIDEWTQILDEGGQIDAIYMDFMKAFDKVPHNRLNSKLHSYMFDPKVLEWIKSFLENRKQEVCVNGEHSSSRDVTSGIPQGSVLGPILFVIYINDMPSEVRNMLYLFADDTKIYYQIHSVSDQERLQEDLDALVDWSNRWLLRFHPKKCKFVSICRSDPIEYSYEMKNEKGEASKLDRSHGEKDIGVTVDDKLNFRQHIQNQVQKANSIMGLIRRSYTYLDEESFCLLFKALVRPHLEYAGAVWSPHCIKDIEDIENVQRRATRQIPTLRDLSYPDRLRQLKLPTLKYRRARGDAIEAFKIINNIHVYDSKVAQGLLPLSQSNRTRGNDKKIEKNSCKKDIRKFSFTQRVTNIWNSLPNSVINADSVKSFKHKLDKFWNNQPVKYNHREDLDLRTGSLKSKSQEVQVDVDKVADSQRP